MHFRNSKKIAFSVFCFIPVFIFSQYAEGLPKMEATKGNLTSFSKSQKTPEIWAKFNNRNDFNHPEFGKLPFNAEYPGYAEVLEKRKKDERFFVNAANPGKFLIQKAMGALHYRMNDQWVTIDHRIEDKGNGILEASYQQDPVGFDMGKFVSYIKTPQGQIVFNNWKLYGTDENQTQVLLASANWNNYTAGDDGIYITGIFPGIDAQMVVNRGSIKTSFIVRKLHFSNYTALLFKDEFKMPLTANFKFTGDYTNPVQSPSKVALVSGNTSILEIGQAIAFPENDKKNHLVIADYTLDNNRLVINIPIKWIEKHIQNSPYIIDPLVTSSNSLAQASILGSMYNTGFPFCNLTNSCNYNLTVNTPANTTLTDVKWSFDYLAQGACAMNDGAVRFTTGACTSPSNAAQYWFCNSVASGTCTGSNISIFNDVSSCLPAPSCAPVPVNFTMKFYRSCAGVAGCDNACIGAFSPWTMTLEGQTVAWTNAANPFSLSSTSMCGGTNVTATSNGIQYGVPTRTITWSFNPSGIPVAGTGSPATFSVPATTGTYTVYGTVTDACGLTHVLTKTLTVLPTPVANAGPTQSLTCVAITTVLSGSGGGTYAWTGPGTITNPTSANPTVNTAGTFSLVVTSGGCSSQTSTVSVIQNNTPPSVVAAASGSLNCTTASTTVVSTTTTSPATYTWTGPGVTGGSNTASATVNAGGTYNYTVTDSGNGCKTVGSVSVTQNTTPPAVAGIASGSLNCTTASTTVVASTTTSPATYTWTGPGITGGSNTASATVNAGGTYNYTVTDSNNGCKTVGSVSVTQNTTPPAVAGIASGSLNCTTASTTVVASTTTSPATYTWTGAGITGGANTASATVNAGGTYNYTVTNSNNGCKTAGSVSVTQNTTPPAIAASTNGTVTCTTLTVNLTSTVTSSSYTWSAPAGSSVLSPNSASTNATGGGTYSLSITSTTNNCTNFTTVAVTTQTTKPTASIVNNPTITCTNTLVTINGGPVGGTTYTWTGPAISGSANNANVNVNGSGVYALSVTSTSNGCVSASSATVNITASTASPAVTMGSNPTIPCSPATVQVTSTVTPGTATVSWSGANVCAGANSQTATACAPGVYTLTATNPSNGCFTKSTLTVNPNAGLNVNVANTGTIYCSPSTVQVVASATPATNNTYAWSGPGIASGNGTSTITVNQGGTYSVTVTNTVSGCSFNFNNTVSANNSSVTPNANQSNVVTCTTPSADITTAPSGSGPFTYSWSTGASSSSVTVNPTITTNYVVTVTNTFNGCTGSETVTVMPNTNPPTAVSVSPGNYTLTCATPSAVLNGTATGATSYTWASSGPPFVSSANQSTVAVAGTYTVFALAANGCSASAVATISPNGSAPVIIVSNQSPTITCGTPPTVSVTVTSTVPVQSYSWNPSAGIAGSNTTSAVTFTAAGTYTAIVTDVNGCSSSSLVSVSSATTPPALVAGTATAQAITCSNTLITISPAYNPSSDLTYSWSGTGIVGSSANNSVQVNQSGSFSVTVTNSVTSCTSSTVVTVTGSTVVPTLTVTSSSSLGITCQPNGGTVTLNAQSGSGSVTYSWSTGAGTSTISTSSPGNYMVTITDSNNGCSASSTITVLNNINIPNISASSSGNLPCGGGNSTLSAVSTNTNLTYTWAGSGIVGSPNTSSVSVNLSGTFTVTGVDAITGCSSSGSVSIAQSSVSALAVADATSGPAPLTVNFTNQSTGASTYSWSFGDGNSSQQTNPSNSFNSTGTYTVTLLASNGTCSDTYTLIVKALDSFGPIPEIFTPNNDTYNDKFFIPGLDYYPNSSMQIFNRWGSPIYSAKPYKNDWDGSPNAQGKTGSGKLPVGTYFYLLELGDENKTIYKGYIQIEY